MTSVGKLVSVQDQNQLLVQKSSEQRNLHRLFLLSHLFSPTESECKETNADALKTKYFAVIAKATGIQDPSKQEKLFVRYGKLISNFTMKDGSVHYCGHQQLRLCSQEIFAQMVRDAIQLHSSQDKILFKGTCQNYVEKDLVHYFFFILNQGRMHIVPHCSRSRLENGTTASVQTYIDPFTSRKRVLKEITLSSDAIKRADHENHILEIVNKWCHANGKKPFCQKPNYANFRIPENGSFIASIQHFYSSYDLFEFLYQKQRLHLSYHQRIDFAIFLFEACRDLHAAGVVHRDLKPENIFVEIVNGQPVCTIGDFGSAIELDKVGEWLKTNPDVRGDCTMEYSCQTTLGQLPSSKGKQAQDLSKSYDLQATALIAGEVLTGAVQPFFEMDDVQILNKMKKAPKRNAEFNFKPFQGLAYSQEFAKLLARYCDRDPTERPTSPKEILDALKELKKNQFPDFPFQPYISCLPISYKTRSEYPLVFELMMLSDLITNKGNLGKLQTSKKMTEWFQQQVTKLYDEATAKEANLQGIKEKCLSAILKNSDVEADTKYAAECEDRMAPFAHMWANYVVDKEGQFHKSECQWDLQTLVTVVRAGIRLQFSQQKNLATGIHKKFKASTGMHDFFFIQGSNQLHIFSFTSRNKFHKGSTAIFETCTDILTDDTLVLKALDQVDNPQEALDHEQSLLQEVHKWCDAHQIEPFCIRPPLATCRVSQENPFLYGSLQHFYAGFDLESFQAQHKYTTQERLNLARYLFESCMHLHEAGIVHRDLRSHHILVDRIGDKLVHHIGGFGSALRLQDAELLNWLKTTKNIYEDFSSKSACLATLQQLKEFSDLAKADKQIDIETVKTLLKSYALQSVAQMVFTILADDEQPFHERAKGLFKAPALNAKFQRDLLEDDYTHLIEQLALHCDRNPAKRPASAEAIIKLLSASS